MLSVSIGIVAGFAIIVAFYLGYRFGYLVARNNEAVIINKVSGNEFEDLTKFLDGEENDNV